MTDLADLLSRDLSTVPDEELVAGIRDAEATRDRATEWSGRLIAELHRRKDSWRVVREMTGLTQGTAGRRAEPYRTPPAE